MVQDLIRDSLNASEMKADFAKFLVDYEYFLRLKEEEGISDDLDSEKKAILDTKAEAFASFLYAACTHSNIEPEYRRYLVI